MSYLQNVAGPICDMKIQLPVSKMSQQKVQIRLKCKSCETPINTVLKESVYEWLEEKKNVDTGQDQKAHQTSCQLLAVHHMSRASDEFRIKPLQISLPTCDIHRPLDALETGDHRLLDCTLHTGYRNENHNSLTAAHEARCFASPIRV